MDPHHVLGIDYTATQEEIKLAYRRVAMKWHPDRNNNSPESRERFHQAALAYKLLFERATRDDRAESEPRGYNGQQDDAADPAGGYGGSHDGVRDSQDESAESVFWEAMLDYAIKLAQNGMSEHDIRLAIARNGCPERLVRSIAEKAYNIHAHYAAGSEAGKKRRVRPDQSSFKDERLDAELWRAFLGQRSFLLSARGAIDYYLMAFREFRQSANLNPLSWISVNRRLMNILSFALAMFAAMLVAVHFFPGPSPYKLLADKDLLQVPLLIPSLMLAWMLYRKLWLASLAFTLFFLASLVWYDSAMPRALNDNTYAVIGVAAVCFAPFVLIVMFANFLYYLKSQRLLRRARRLFADQLDQLVWIKNRAGTSASAAFLFLLVFVSSGIHFAPQFWDINAPGGYSRAAANLERNAAKVRKVRLQIEEAQEFFDIAEKHFSHSPPDYVKAEMAYSTAADNGSLLAAYKLGYMYYSGEGAAQNDKLAFDYFRRATQAPLAFQPHGLDITTRFLAESYNSLGIMYQGGIGTSRNLQEADRMFRRALEFGSASARKNLEMLYQTKTRSGRMPLAYPEFR
jgi:curved DNA-binding protein CbpA/TPR repeat protein